MKHHNVRERLIEQTILTVAQNGLDKTTTKAIVTGTDINEAYIYSNFGNKEDLLAKTFDHLDYELVEKLTTHLAIMSEPELDYHTRCRFYFEIIWRFILNNRDRAICFLRYYYSPYFQKNSADEHKLRYEKITEKLSLSFKPRANVWMLLNHMLNVIFDFAVKVFNDAVPDNDDTAEHVFNLLYYSISPYIKDEVKNTDNRNEVTING